jgi:hypothetical protein
MEQKELIAYFFGGFVVLKRFVFRGAPIFIGSSNKHAIFPTKSFESSTNISTQNTSNNISEMRIIIHIRQCCGYKNISRAIRIIQRFHRVRMKRKAKAERMSCRKHFVFLDVNTDVKTENNISKKIIFPRK